MNPPRSIPSSGRVRRIRRFLHTAMACWLMPAALCWAQQAPAPGHESSPFHDPRLRAAVQRALPKAPPAIDRAFLEKATIAILDLSDSGIESLEGIELVRGLQKLNLAGNAIEDISWLSAHEYLQTLNLAGNRVSNLWPLAVLPDIDFLVLDDNPVRDLGPVSALSNLKHLSLAGLSLSDAELAPVGGLTKLTVLNLDGNRAAEAPFLVRLNALESLSIRGNLLTSIAPLLANPGLSGADRIALDENPLPVAVICRDIPEFTRRFNQTSQVSFTGTCEGMIVINVKVDGGGTVTPPPGLNYYPPGAVVELAACRNCNGVLFSHWEGAPNETQLNTSWTATRDASVKAVFVPADVQLATAVHGEGTLVPEAGRYGFRRGETAVVMAVPSAREAFHHWKGADSGRQNPLRISMQDDAQLEAVFGAGDFTLVLSVEGGGATRPAPGRYRYMRGDQVVLRVCLTCTTRKFSHWAGDVSGNELELSVAMNSDIRVTAVFDPE